MPQIQTSRLLLRPWRESDFGPYAALNCDPKVREFFGSTLSYEESFAEAKRFSKRITETGFGLWAVEVPGLCPFIGFIGLQPVSFQAPFTPAVELGYRLAYDHWGKGYASEGSKAALDYAFQVLGLSEVVAFTTATNLRSRAVMEKVGMTYNPLDDFDHPKLPPRHTFSRHVLYRLQRKF